MWMTRADPARSCRSSMFCVTSVRLPPLAASAALEPGERGVGGVGFRVHEVAPAQIIEREHRVGIAREGFRRRELHRIEPRPDALPVLVAKRAEPAFGRDAGAGQDEDVFRHATS